MYDLFYSIIFLALLIINSRSNWWLLVPPCWYPWWHRWYCIHSSKRRFSSQYAFDQALALLLTSAHEGHLYTSFCTSLSISYQRGIDLISLSSDGIKLPKIYVLGMYNLLNFSINSNIMADDVQSASNSIVDISNIVTINEKDASEYIRELAIVQVSDLDASYNSMFWNLGQYPGHCSS